MSHTRTPSQLQHCYLKEHEIEENLSRHEARLAGPFPVPKQRDDALRHGTEPTWGVMFDSTLLEQTIEQESEMSAFIRTEKHNAGDWRYYCAHCSSRRHKLPAMREHLKNW